MYQIGKWICTCARVHGMLRDKVAKDASPASYLSELGFQDPRADDLELVHGDLTLIL